MPGIAPECLEFEEDLSALIDAELGPAREREVTAHVRDCARCSARVTSLRGVDELLGRMPVRDAPEALRSGLVARIAAETSASPPARAYPGRRDWSRRPAWAAAVAAAAALALYLLLPEGPQVPAVLPRERPQIAERPASPPAPPVLPEVIEEKAPLIAEHPAPATPVAPRLALAEAIAPREVARETVAEITPPSLVESESETADEIVAQRATRTPTPLVEFDEVPEEDLALILDLETLEDLELIANIDVLERLMALEEGV